MHTNSQEDPQLLQGQQDQPCDECQHVIVISQALARVVLGGAAALTSIGLAAFQVITDDVVPLQLLAFLFIFGVYVATGLDLSAIAKKLVGGGGGGGSGSGGGSNKS